AHKDVRWQDKNEVGLAARAAMLRVRSGASILHCDHGALRPLLPLRLYKKSVFYQPTQLSTASAKTASEQNSPDSEKSSRKVCDVMKRNAGFMAKASSMTFCGQSEQIKWPDPAIHWLSGGVRHARPSRERLCHCARYCASCSTTHRKREVKRSISCAVSARLNPHPNREANHRQNDGKRNDKRYDGVHLIRNQGKRFLATYAIATAQPRSAA